MGVAQDNYRTSNGNLDGFEEYYDHLTQSEITQLTGRPRAHQSPDDKFVIYIIGNHNLDHLKEYGINVVNCHAAEIDINAATNKQQSQYKFIKAVSELNGFRKLTRKSLAKETGLSEEYIKKLVGKLGGIVNFREWVLELIESLSNNHTQDSLLDFLLDQDKIRSWMGLNPEKIAAEALEAVDAIGWSKFQVYLDGFTVDIQAKIWSSLLSLLLSEHEILELQAEIFPPPE